MDIAVVVVGSVLALMLLVLAIDVLRTVAGVVVYTVQAIPRAVAYAVGWIAGRILKPFRR